LTTAIIPSRPFSPATNAITALPDNVLMAERTPVENILRDATDMLRTENLVVEAMRDLVKDEAKRYIRSKIDANPELKDEIKAAVEELMEAKIREGYALVKLAKAGVKLGLELVPPKMRGELAKDLVDLIQKEIGGLMEKTL